MRFQHILVFVLFMSSFAIMNEINYNFTENHFELMQAISPNSQMMIYKTKTPTINTSYVESRANELFAFAGIIEENEESFVITEGNVTFEMNKETGAIWYADYRKLWNISYEPTLPPPSTCKQTADAFLTNNDLLPAEAYFVTYGSTNATSYNIATTDTATKILDTQVKYGFEIETTEVYGPEAEITVYCGEGGEIIGLAWAWRELEEFILADLYDLNDMLSYYGIGINEVVDSSLVYYANPDETYHGYLYPMYKLDLINVTTELTIEYVRYIPATDFNPRVKITSPISITEAIEGDSLFFDCIVDDGNGSYKYSWDSNVDGQISTAKSFDYSSLSVVLKNESLVTHTITVTVTDAFGLTSEDSIQIKINATPTDGFRLSLVAGLIFSLSIGGFLYYKKKKKVLTVGFIGTIIILSSFSMPFLIESKRSQANIAIINPNQKYYPESEGDDEIWEVGAEWCTYPGGKRTPNCDDSAERIYYTIDSYTWWHGSFIYGNDQAAELDFKDLTFSGRDRNYIDSVDLAYWAGHGSAYSIQFTTSNNFNSFTSSRARWGNTDLEWIILDTCKALRFSDGTRTVFDAWADAFRGLHMICGFHTKCSDVKSRGEKFANYAESGNRIINSWFIASIRTESYKKYAAVLYATGSENPWLPIMFDTYYDHLWGFGSVGIDPYPWSHLVYLSSRC